MRNAIRPSGTFSSADLSARVGSRREAPLGQRARGAGVRRLGAFALLALVALAATLGYSATAGDAQQTGPVNRLDLGVVAIDAQVGGEAVHYSGTVIDAERGLVLTSVRA